MPTFSYKAYDSDGHVIESELEASNLEGARAILTQQKLLVSMLKEKRSGTAINLPWQKKSVSLDDLEFITSELAILLNSGVKIDKGLSIIARSKGKGATGQLIAEILSNLKSGKGIAESFQTKKDVFDSLYINLIAIGEKSGKLPQVFEGLASDLKFKKALKAKVTQAMTYPAVILVVCIACLLFVFNYIVPQMGSIFTEGDELPIYTAILIGASNWMIKYQVFVFIFICLLAAIFVKQRKSARFKTFWSTYALSFWVVSDLIKQVERIRFNSSMHLMLDAGVKVDTAIGAATKNIGNSVIRKSLEIANEKIKKGYGVAESLAKTPIFPLFYVSLLEVGEESGQLPTVFQEIASRSKSEFESWTDRVTSMLEPLLILVMGGIVGSVVITMLLSVVSVNDINI